MMGTVNNAKPNPTTAWVQAVAKTTTATPMKLHNVMSIMKAILEHTP